MALFHLKKWLEVGMDEVTFPVIVVVPDHPELDQPDGEVGFEDYLDVLCKLDLTLLDMEKRERLADQGGTPAE